MQTLGDERWNGALDLFISLCKPDSKLGDAHITKNVTMS